MKKRMISIFTLSFFMLSSSVLLAEENTENIANQAMLQDTKKPKLQETLNDAHENLKFVGEFFSHKRLIILD